MNLLKRLIIIPLLLGATMAQSEPPVFVGQQQLSAAQSFGFVLIHFDNYKSAFSEQDTAVLLAEATKTTSFEYLNKKSQSKTLLGVCKNIKKIKNNLGYAPDHAVELTAKVMAKGFIKIDAQIKKSEEDRYQHTLKNLSESGQAMLMDNIIVQVSASGGRSTMDWQTFAETDPNTFTRMYSAICADEEELTRMVESTEAEFVKEVKQRMVSTGGKGGDVIGSETVTYTLKTKKEIVEK